MSRQPLSRAIADAKQMFGRLPFPLVLRGYYATYGIAMEARARVVQHQLALPPITALDLRSIKRSDTVFVLGSGSSINEIPESRWRGIAKHDSFGFNFWIRHDFVPTLYSIECLERVAEAREIVTWSRVAHDRADAYAHVPKLVTDLKPPGTDMLRLFPASWRETTFGVPVVSTFARNTSELEQALAYLERSGEFDEASHVRRLFKYRATVTSMITLAVRMGYRRIVLCGFDLSNPAYFYHDISRYPDMAGFSSSPAGAVHSTLKARGLLLPIDVIIREMQRLILAPRGVRLYVENRSSALHRDVELAPETLFS